MEKQAENNCNTATTGDGNSSSSGGGGLPQPNKDLSNEFYNTGRVGRRNALPDILGPNCTTSTADLPGQLESLSTDGK